MVQINCLTRKSTWTVKSVAIFAKDAEKDLKAFFVRQERAITEKIAQAETDAVKEVRAAAVEVAVDAASTILKEELSGDAGHELTDKAIKELQSDLT